MNIGNPQRWLGGSGYVVNTEATAFGQGEAGALDCRDISAVEVGGPRASMCRCCTPDPGSSATSAVRHAARALSWRRRGTGVQTATTWSPPCPRRGGRRLLLKSIHLVQCSLFVRRGPGRRRMSSRAGCWARASRTAAASTERPSMGSSRNDSSAKAIGGVMSGGPCSIRRDYGDPSSSPAWCGQTAVGSNVVRTQVSWCRWCLQRCEICNCCRW
jgi:hypothetical protein